MKFFEFWIPVWFHDFNELTSGKPSTRNHVFFYNKRFPVKFSSRPILGSLEGVKWKWTDKLKGKGKLICKFVHLVQNSEFCPIQHIATNAIFAVVKAPNITKESPSLLSINSVCFIKCFLCSFIKWWQTMINNQFFNPIQSPHHYLEDIYSLTTKRVKRVKLEAIEAMANVDIDDDKYPMALP